MLKKIKSAFGYTATNKVISKEAEYKLYEKVAKDIKSKERDEGVWASAFAKSQGDNQKTEAKYIEFMVQRYKDWIEAGVEISEILEKSYKEFEKRDIEAEKKAVERNEEKRRAQEKAAAERRAQMLEVEERLEVEESFKGDNDMTFAIIFIAILLFSMFMLAAVYYV